MLLLNHAGLKLIHVSKRGHWTLRLESHLLNDRSSLTTDISVNEASRPSRATRWFLGIFTKCDDTICLFTRVIPVYEILQIEFKRNLITFIWWFNHNLDLMKHLNHSDWKESVIIQFILESQNISCTNPPCSPNKTNRGKCHANRNSKNKLEANSAVGIFP